MAILLQLPSTLSFVSASSNNCYSSMNYSANQCVCSFWMTFSFWSLFLATLRFSFSFFLYSCIDFIKLNRVETMNVSKMGLLWFKSSIYHLFLLYFFTSSLVLFLLLFLFKVHLDCLSSLPSKYIRNFIENAIL